MRIYTVHVKETDRSPPDDLKAVAVREAFSVWAFLLRFVWAAFNGAWIVAAILFGIEIALGATILVLGMDGGTALLLTLVWMFAVGLFARDLKRWELSVLGYEFGGAVVAENGDDALRRYFADTGLPAANVDGPTRSSPGFREDVVAPSVAGTPRLTTRTSAPGGPTPAGPTPAGPAPAGPTPASSTPSGAAPAGPHAPARIPADYDPASPTAPRPGPRLS